MSQSWNLPSDFATHPIQCRIEPDTTLILKLLTLRRHLLEKGPISKLCEELGLQPTVFYRWQKEFFENRAAASPAKGTRSDHQAEQDRILYLEKKTQRKDEVLAEPN